MKRSIFVLLSTFLAASHAPAAETMDIGKLPRARTQGLVSYMTSGRRGPESRAIQRFAHNYPVEMHFLTPGDTAGDAMDEVAVRIVNQSGQAVLTTLGIGPILLTDLAPGRYSVTAVYGQKPKLRTFDVARGEHESLFFDWAT